MTEAGARPRPLRAAMLASVVASVTASALVAPPAAAARAATLRGTTTFTASRNAVATIRLPRASMIDIDVTRAATPNAEVSGRGRLVGFVLAAVRQPASGESASLFVTKVGACHAAGCEPTEPRWAVEYADAAEGLPSQMSSPNTKRVTLPAGHYYVRSVTDGAPVRMTLRLPGLSGSATVAVTTPSRVVLRADASPPGVAEVDPLRSAGPVTHESARGNSLLIYVILVDHQPHVRSLNGACYYRDRSTPPPPGRYSAACPNAFHNDMRSIGFPTLHYYGTSIGGANFLTPGTYSIGYYSNGVGAKSALHAVTLWLDLV